LAREGGMSNLKNEYDPFLAFLLQGNRAECSKLVDALIEQKVSHRDIYEDLFKRALYDVGELWQQNRISVATEHMATALIEGLIHRIAAQKAPTETSKKKILSACVESEQHQVGIKMVSDIFEAHGWESIFAGASMPKSELMRFIEEQNPDLVAISLNIYFHLNELLDTLSLLREKFPHIPVIIGGQAFRHGGESIAEDFIDVTLISDLEELEHYIESLQVKS
jgi:MerR family transcriptional regulator, light-induced transcriptional regulator